MPLASSNTSNTCASLTSGFGERAGSRTQNLLISNREPKTNGFNGFPAVQMNRNRQIEPRLFPSVFPRMLVESTADILRTTRDADAM